jgi:hypothetical protein
MHPLHDDIARILGDKVKARSVVVWYDPRSEFLPFVDELRGTPAVRGEAATVSVGGGSVTLVQFDASMFELRARIEPLISGETPERVVVYLPGVTHHEQSVLMEAEKAGDLWTPRLKQVARNTLRKRYTDGIIDGLLLPEAVTYQDLVAAASDEGSESPSLLKAIFARVNGTDGMLTAWLASDDRDAEIESKLASRELFRLIRSRLGLELADDTTLVKARAATLRYILGGEFRLDLLAASPASLAAVPSPRTKAEEQAIRDLALRLRTSFPLEYPELADGVETALSLTPDAVAPDALGAIDTFRFEERVVLAYCGELITGRRFDDALVYVSQREQNFWLERDVARRAQWEACRLMAELGKAAAEVTAQVKAASGGPAEWVERYTDTGGWMRLDQAQRRMETFVAKLDDDPSEHALAVVRQGYESAAQLMADGFTKALDKGGWQVPGVLHQTHVYGDVVTGQPVPVAYFLVDAMRFEMGVELGGRLPKTAEVRVRPAVAALPSITPVGMAALQPGASASFDVVADNGKLGSRIEGTFLPDLTARRKFAASRIAAVVDTTLGDVLAASKTKLAAMVAGAEVIIVRSQEIDLAGETGLSIQARHVMDSVIDDLARAVRRLADAGVEHAVLSADHGHFFLPSDRDEAMRVESPGGSTVELHRRCWIGRGGSTPPGCIRVSAAQLGYASDLEVVFPRGAGVFKAGGDLGFHHGGPALQELIVPVVTVRSVPTAAPVGKKEPLGVRDLPYQITNRIFSVKVVLGGQNLSLFSVPSAVKPVLLDGDHVVGAVGMATGAEIDRSAGTVTLTPGREAEIAFLLSDDSVASVRIVVRDPATDAELYRSPTDIPVKLGVG